MSDYKPGEMDITEQEKTFVGFIKVGIWTGAAAIGVLIFLALFNS
ncbi:aa3-type cytochrome c oxidase subunit IV [Oceanomicrobium pacificus]|uniref:Aa3-type cytochrome c oxidase subunit IV n=1 Tax=Oceanomicrobium pacificus TaxID=2692916 RepID=A0A6B0TQ77_9RHOB|nr:aa3-type cytochrome c oxidase subunit IV [Oceanomicrobium pacificus]MXU66807.1 aa3-type cytochrome c oxidase subunit IV [Oceanomicrobium pacificus]